MDIELYNQNDKNLTIGKEEQDHLRFLINESIPLNTRIAYQSDWKMFNQWCQSRNLVPLPCSPETLALFLMDESKTKSPKTIIRRIASIKFVHEAKNLDTPTNDKVVKKLLRGIVRTSNHITEKKAPVTAERLEQMVGFCQYTITGTRDRALLLLGFAGAFRRSELVALTMKDIVKTPEGIKVTIRKSKGDQDGKGQTIAIPNGTRFRIVDALLAWIKVANITDGFIFRSIRKGGKVQQFPLTCKSVANIVKQYASQAGLTVSDFSGHSLRSGFLTSAARSGASVFKMMETSRHKNIETLSGYVRSENLFENHAGEKFL